MSQVSHKSAPGGVTGRPLSLRTAAFIRIRLLSSVHHYLGILHKQRRSKRPPGARGAERGHGEWRPSAERGRGWIYEVSSSSETGGTPNSGLRTLGAGAKRPDPNSCGRRSFVTGEAGSCAGDRVRETRTEQGTLSPRPALRS